MKKITTIASFLITFTTLAQDTTTIPNSLSFSAYVEAYYSYDFNKPSDNNRHNEFNVNLGYVKGSYNADRVRANLAIAAGTYMNANYSAEAGVLKNIYEANAGVKLSKKPNLWFDMPSHIG